MDEIRNGPLALYCKVNFPHNSQFFQNPLGISDKVLAILPDSSGGMVSSKARADFGVSQVLNGGEGPQRHQQAFPGSTAHDAVLVLDPSPGENFGHPVVLFYVDVNVTKKRCSHLDGIYLGESFCALFKFITCRCIIIIMLTIQSTKIFCLIIASAVELCLSQGGMILVVNYLSLVDCLALCAVFGAGCVVVRL